MWICTTAVTLSWWCSELLNYSTFPPQLHLNLTPLFMRSSPQVYNNTLVINIPILVCGLLIARVYTHFAVFASHITGLTGNHSFSNAYTHVVGVNHWLRHAWPLFWDYDYYRIHQYFILQDASLRLKWLSSFCISQPCYLTTSLVAPKPASFYL